MKTAPVQGIRPTLQAGVLATALLLGGCGGGSPTPVVNRPPTFSSPATASVSENTANAFYTASAIDPEGGAVTYTISGGADAAAFTLSGGQLAFATAPNFDLPGDADANNVYLVQLRASDGVGTSTIDLQITVTNSKEGIAVRRIATGFVDPVAISAIPGDTKLFVAERGGRIFLLDPATGVKTLFQTLATTTTGDRGIRAIVTQPDYAATGRYFVLASGSTGSVQLYTCMRGGIFGSPICDSSVFGAPHAETNNYGGFLGYGPDGKLYAGTGDGGGSRDPGGTAQQDDSHLGKVLRIDLNPDPYAGAGPRPYLFTEIAKGLHNPRGVTFLNGQLLLGDRGETTREEIDLVPLTAGGNLGWPSKEGTVVIAAPVPAGAIDPVIEYPHVTGGGVVAGYVYRGQVTSLQNQYVFADQSGVIFSLPASRITAGPTVGSSAFERRTADFAPDAGTLTAPVAFGEDNNGDLYIVDAGGEIFRVTRE